MHALYFMLLFLITIFFFDVKNLKLFTNRLAKTEFTAIIPIRYSYFAGLIYISCILYIYKADQSMSKNKETMLKIAPKWETNKEETNG